MRHHPLLRPGGVVDATVLSIDVAPRLLELGGAKIPSMHGRSLLPILKGENRKGRESILIKYHGDDVWPRMVRMGYQAARTDRFKYIRYTEFEDMDEIYDLAADPYGMKNIIRDPSAQDALRRMKAELDKLVKENS